MKRKSFRIYTTVLLVSIALHGVALVQFVLIRDTLSVGEIFAWQFYILVAISLFLSCLVRFSDSGFLIPGILKLGLLFFIGYPLEGYIGVELTLYLALVLEAAIWLHPRWGLLFQAAALTILLISQQAVSAFYMNLSRPPLHDIVSLGFYSLSACLLFLLLNKLLIDRAHSALQIKRLDAAVGQLTRANLGFQSYASHLEKETLHSERKRISREIHDTVGYSLTNILMMLEAAGDLLEEDAPRSRQLMEGSIDEARRCLEETRASMRELRSSEMKESVGLAAVAGLCASFSQATGVSIETEYGNARASYGMRTDSAILRMLQEGMTNAFRHGMATGIRIQFWEQQDLLHVRLQDNGRGANDAEEGIGLAGMRERIESLGGEFTAGNGAGGFRIDALVPVTRVQRGEN